MTQENIIDRNEQLSILNRVSDRLLEEFRLEKEGLLLHKTDPERAKSEQPLLGFCHVQHSNSQRRLRMQQPPMLVEAVIFMS